MDKGQTSWLKIEVVEFNTVVGSHRSSYVTVHSLYQEAKELQLSPATSWLHAIFNSSDKVSLKDKHQQLSTKQGQN